MFVVSAVADAPVMDQGLVVAIAALQDGQLDGSVARGRLDLRRRQRPGGGKRPQQIALGFQSVG